MALTANDIITRARSRYNAENDTFFDDAMLMAAIYDAESILAKEGYVIEKTYTTPSVAGTRTYSLPSTTLAIKEVKYNYRIIDKSKLDRDPKTSVSSLTGTPNEYALWDGALILYPAPVNAGSLDINNNMVDYIEVRVYKHPDDVTSTASTLDIPEEYKEDIISYILKIMAFKDQNLNLYDRLKQEWDECVLRVKKQGEKRKRSDQGSRVTDTYFGSDITTARRGGYYF